MRLHELAKELGLSSKELLAQAKALGIEAKSHMSALTEDDVTQLRKPAGKAATVDAPAAQTATVEKANAPKPSETTGAEKEPPAAQEPKAPAVTTPPPAREIDTPPQEEDAGGLKTLTVRGPIVVREFAEELGLKPNQLIAELMRVNIFASINEKLELKTAQMLAEKHGFKLQHEKKVTERRPVQVDEEPDANVDLDKPEDLKPRPPVVAFLGHVDHGKTSLLDQIRSARVAAGEDGGITQHIGAYSIDTDGHRITFLDTPGHAAFTAMRARGANLTDICVIIVAADDGIMPQTKEAIQHAQAADVAIMVAINKIDLPGANVDRVKQQLQQEGLPPEDWGGDTICCPVSAATGEGIPHLLEMITLQAEIMELNANPSRRAQGYVIEARLEPGMGPTANVLVRHGTLSVGDAMLCGPYSGRIKALINDQGQKVDQAGPSTPVKCLGLTDVPEAGEEFRVYANERTAKRLSEERQSDLRTKDLEAPKRAALADWLNTRPGDDQKEELPVILKADVQGSLEAIRDSLTAIESQKISPRFVLTGVGNITENDVLLASASNALLLGFHVSTEPGANNMAKREGVEIRLYAVIYELLDEVRDVMTGRLAPERRENITGHIEIRQVFDISKRGKIAGCMVVDGRITSRSRARLIRDGETVFEGVIGSLKRFQNDASEVRDGQECGIRLENFADYREGDTIEVYDVEEVAQAL